MGDVFSKGTPELGNVAEHLSMAEKRIEYYQKETYKLANEIRELKADLSSAYCNNAFYREQLMQENFKNITMREELRKVHQKEMNSNENLEAIMQEAIESTDLVLTPEAVKPVEVMQPNLKRRHVKFEQPGSKRRRVTLSGIPKSEGRYETISEDGDISSSIDENTSSSSESQETGHNTNLKKNGFSSLKRKKVRRISDSSDEDESMGKSTLEKRQKTGSTSFQAEKKDGAKTNVVGFPRSMDGVHPSLWYRNKSHNWKYKYDSEVCWECTNNKCKARASSSTIAYVCDQICFGSKP